MRKLFSLLILFAPLLVSCESMTGPDKSHIGTFNLATVNGGELPFLAAEVGDDQLELTEGALTISEDGFFTNEFTLRETIAGKVTAETRTVSGTFARDGNEVTFVDGSGDSFTGALSGSTLTIAGPELTFVYRK